MVGNRRLILQRYRPIVEAGSGGFGTVQVAWDTRIQRKVAIKIIELDEADAARAALPGADAMRAPQASWDEGAGFAEEGFEDDGCEGSGAFDKENAEPFVRSLAHVPGLDEARTAAMLSDASIVAVYDFEVQGSTAYLIMEYVEGMTLTQLLRRYDEHLTLDIVAAVFAAVSHALEVAHDNQVLHLDIKPDNVLINRQGQVKVTDFGLATLADASGFGVAGGGTIGYMPLEQMRQESLDARCDEWALASVVYEMLAGENPFLAPDLARAEASIEDAELVLPSLCWDELDAAADDVIFYALDPDREERYDNVTDFAEELEPFLGDPKRGVRELAALVGQARMDNEEDERALEKAPVDRVPLNERVTWRQRVIAAHVLGAAGSALVALLALSNVPVPNEMQGPVFWGLLALIALAGALKPHLGALLAYVALATAFIVRDAPAAGCVLLAATAAWWYGAGRKGDAAANVAFVPALGGAVGLGPIAPLAAGFCLRPARAIATTAFCVLVATLLAACGSQTLLGWEAFAHMDFAGVDIQAGMFALLVQPAYWCMVASWFVAALALSVFRLRKTRAFAALGTIAAGALLLGGLFAAGYVTGATAQAPALPDLLVTLGSSVLVLVACVFVETCPDEYAYDDVALAGDEG